MEKERKILAMNEFHDIGNLPPKEGLVILPISIGKIQYAQSGKKCLKFINQIGKKITRGLAGVNFIYTDNLYQKYNPSKENKNNKYTQQILNHKNEFKKALRKLPVRAEKAFEFMSWMQIILQSENFTHLLYKTQQLYEKDKKFKSYVHEDIKKQNKRINKNAINFILEETLISYLVLKHEIELQNQYVNGRDKWRLLCYPGTPNKSMIYFWQKNIFNKKSVNPYGGQYNMESKKFYNFDKIDLETIKF